MKVALVSIAKDRAGGAVDSAFAKHAALYPPASHSITADFTIADCILFVDLHLCEDPFLSPLRKHPLLLRYPEKVMMYDDRDEPWCALPGVYVSMPRGSFDRQRQRACAYHTVANNLASAEPAMEPDLLFSFIGSPGHRTSLGHKVRRALLQTSHPRAVIENSSGFVFYDHQGDPDAHRSRQQHFADIISRSKFVICPRGRGTSSFRMYEALRAGRIPVILADEWVAPPGPQWENFTLTVCERDVKNVVAIIEANEHRWDEMSNAARNAYECWFSPQVAVGRIFDLCAELFASPAPPRPYWKSAGYGAMCLRSVRMGVRRFGGTALRAARIKR